MPIVLSVSHQLPQFDFSSATTGAGPAYATPVRAAALIIDVTTLLFIVNMWLCDWLMCMTFDHSLASQHLFMVNFPFENYFYV